MENMSKEKLLGLTRHILTFLGGYLMTEGFVDESTWMEASGLVVTVVGIVWSIKNKKESKEVKKEDKELLTETKE
jgi:flagellar motor component MotA